MEEINFDDIKELFDNFQNFHKTVNYTMMEKTERFNISINQTKLLLMLQKHHNINQNALAKKLNVTKATLSVRLQRLEKLGYLTRVQDEHDKRNYVSKEQINVLNDVIKIMKKNIEECKGEK